MLRDQKIVNRPNIKIQCTKSQSRFEKQTRTLGRWFWKQKQWTPCPSPWILAQAHGAQPCSLPYPMMPCLMASHALAPRVGLKGCAPNTSKLILLYTGTVQWSLTATNHIDLWYHLREIWILIFLFQQHSGAPQLRPSLPLVPPQRNVNSDFLFWTFSSFSHT